MKYLIFSVINSLITFFLTFFDSQAIANNKIFRTNDQKTLQGVVISCHDGDTCRIQTNSKEFKVRFSGIDAPELKQPEGKMSRDYLKSLILNKTVRLDCEGKSYDRKTCTVYLGEVNINEEMVKSGMALDSPKYSKGKYKPQMDLARSKQLGIWKSITRSPACFRHKMNPKCFADPLAMF